MVVCTGCGLVQKLNAVDQGAEWRSFGVNEKGEEGGKDMSRVGGKVNPYLSNFGLDIKIQGG